MVASDLFPLPTLETRRLVLRAVTREDADALHALRSNASVNAYLARPKTPSAADVRAFVDSLIEARAPYWVITPKARDELAGTICLMNLRAEDARAEVGFELHPDFQGEGLMQEALNEVLALASARGFRVIEGWVHKDNANSIKLLQKVGFTRDLKAEANNADNEELQTMAIYSLRCGG